MVDQVGQRFGDYHLLRFLGGGTFGDVYLGEHVTLKTPFAVKVFKSKLTSDKFKDFLNEVRTVLLRHSNIVQIIDFGVREDDIPFLVMEYAPNGTLRQRHRRGTHLSLATIIPYVKQISAALQYAHENRRIHRDVKPENMLVGANNQILLSDFGIAVVAHSPNSQRTEEAIGTAPYMAPEQWHRKPVPASDQYALGTIVYEWLCGETPFKGDILELMHQHLFETPLSLHKKAPWIPLSVEQVILQALSKEPALRFETIEAFATTLEKVYMSEELGSAEIIGIDLGTTTSCVAVVEDSRPIVIPNSEGEYTTPSVVAQTSDGDWLAGEAAQIQAVSNPDNTISSFLRFIGRKYDDPAIDYYRRSMTYSIVRSPENDAWIEVQGRGYSLQEIAAVLLRKLKDDAQTYLGERVRSVVITVPAYFNSMQRYAISQAAKLAGLEVVRTIDGSVAASLAYGLGRKQDEHIVIFDLGGGTLSISIVELGDGVFEVKNAIGDMHLGGDDFDQRIINWLVDEFRREHGTDLRQDRMALQRLKEAVVKAKKELSSVMQTEINLPFITADTSGPKHLKMALTRLKLEQLVEDLIEKSRGLVIKALSDVDSSPEDIQKIVLVGGQTRMPALKSMLRRIFNRELNFIVNPEDAAVIGAAIQGGCLTGGIKDVLLLDVIGISLGIETLGGIFTRMIERNTSIPTLKSRVFLTASDNQSCVEIHVLEGEREFAKDNTSVGSFVLDGISPAPRHVPQIEITLDIDANRIVQVSAHDKGTGLQEGIIIHPGVNTFSKHDGNCGALVDCWELEPDAGQ